MIQIPSYIYVIYISTFANISKFNCRYFFSVKAVSVALISEKSDNDAAKCQHIKK